MYRPWAGRRFGLEMEVNSRSPLRTFDLEHLAEAVQRGLDSVPNNREQVVNRRGYGHSDGSRWEVKTDSSCGYEVVTPAFMLTEQGQYPQLKEVTRELRHLGPTVDSRCGLHVHVECSDFDWRDMQRLLRLWVRYEPFFYELVPLRRSSNSYCIPLRGGRNGWGNGLADSQVREALTATREQSFATHSRYLLRTLGLNTLGWWRHRRVEFRLHSGTLNYDKLRAWTMLMAAVVGRVKATDMPPIDNFNAPTDARPLSTSYVLKQLGLLPSSIKSDVAPESIELAAWINARRQQLAGQGPSRSQVRTPEVRVPGPPQIANPGLFETPDRCCAVGANCMEPRMPGRLLCSQHNDDYVNSRGFLIRQGATV
jgi:hypothetical protein